MSQTFCDTGKERFESPGADSMALRSLSKRNRKHTFSTYKCEECNGYHITTVSKKIKKYKRK